MTPIQLRWIAIVGVAIVFGLVYSNGIARAKSLGIAETRIEAAVSLDSLVAIYTLAADSAETRAITADSTAARQARSDSMQIARLEGRIGTLSAQADSIGAEIEEHLVDDPEALIAFQEYVATTDSTMVALRSELQISRNQTDAANNRAELWRASDISKDLIISTQVDQIVQLNGAVDAALDAANRSLFENMKSSWWLVPVGYGLAELLGN